MCYVFSLGNETISHDEFREGIHSLQHQLGTKFTKQQIDESVTSGNSG
jgi:hypothetical protein